MARTISLSADGLSVPLCQSCSLSEVEYDCVYLRLQMLLTHKCRLLTANHMGRLLLLSGLRTISSVFELPGKAMNSDSGVRAGAGDEVQ